MLDLDALAESLSSVKRDGRVVGDEARREVSEVLEPRIAALMAQGMTRTEAVARLLTEARVCG